MRKGAFLFLFRETYRPAHSCNCPGWVLTTGPNFTMKWLPEKSKNKEYEQDSPWIFIYSVTCAQNSKTLSFPRPAVVGTSIWRPWLFAVRGAASENRQGLVANTAVKVNWGSGRFMDKCPSAPTFNTAWDQFCCRQMNSLSFFFFFFPYQNFSQGKTGLFIPTSCLDIFHKIVCILYIKLR